MDLSNTISTLHSPDIDPLFWTPQLIGKQSGWWGHVPFAFWLMAAARPPLFVELGTHHGVSYSAFCEAVIRAKTGTCCYAIDTWHGDPHAGEYGEDVYQDFRQFHDARYMAFSELIRGTFDEARPRFRDGAIDLLHIDGLHTYDAVRHDFESWLPKLSRQGLVIFHDTNVRRDDFGVAALFGELSQQYPHFEFLHGYGLGLLAVGPEVPDAVGALCSLGNISDRNSVREKFSLVGARWANVEREQMAAAAAMTQIDRLARERDAALHQVGELQAADVEAKRLCHDAHRAQKAVEQELSRSRAEHDQLAVTLSETNAKVAELEQTAAQAQGERDRYAAELSTALATAHSEADHLHGRLKQLEPQHQEELKRRAEQAAEHARYIHDSYRTSTSWRLTAPIRLIKGGSVAALRRIGSPAAIHKGDRLPFHLKAMRAGYRALPLGKSGRGAIIGWFSKTYPGPLRTYETWRQRQQAPAVPSLSQPGLIEPRPKRQINLPTSNAPLVSVIIPVYGKIDYTLSCLQSIAKAPPACPFEVIVVDDCSPDNTREVLTSIGGIRVLSNVKNLGFLRSCNRGSLDARGKYLHFLNNDTTVTKGWLDELTTLLEASPDIGLVGSKLVYPDGRLQEAGGIIWADGSAWNWGRLRDPQHPAYNYVRDVDYISGASIMIAKSLFEELKRFDERYQPAYYEDTDLAMMVRKAGRRVVYQPKSVIWHFEGISSGTDVTSGTKRYQEINRHAFVEKWQAELSGNPPNGWSPFRACDKKPKGHVLIVDACTPTPDQDSGSIDMFNLIKILIGLSYRVHFVPQSNYAHFGAYTDRLQEMGVECLYAPYYLTLETFLAERGDVFDFAILARTSVAQQTLPIIKMHAPSARTIFYTVDLHFLRERGEAELVQDHKKLERAAETERVELGLMDQVDATVVLSVAEHDLLAQKRKVNLHIIPLIRDVVEPIGTRLRDRNGVVFVGGFQHTPNVDAVDWLALKIWPEVRRLTAEGGLAPIRLHIVGSKMPERFQEHSCADVTVHGFVPDLANIFAQVRLSVAPLRFGAGLKGKVAQSFLMGVPVVGTSLAFEGFPTRDLDDVRFAADDPATIAALVVKLHTRDDIWAMASEHSRRFAVEHFSTEHAARLIEKLLKCCGAARTSHQIGA